MSCDYFVFCRTCKERHSFNDANHQDKLMHALVRHAKAIAALAPLMNEDPTHGGIELRTSYGSIDPTWFAHHQGHDLCVIDEYGKIDGTCGAFFECGWCSCRHYCVLATGHPGPCSNKLLREHAKDDSKLVVHLDNQSDRSVEVMALATGYIGQKPDRVEVTIRDKATEKPSASS